MSKKGGKIKEMNGEQLFVKRIVNNNIVIAEDCKQREIIVIGKGLGFKKDIRSTIYPYEITKTYILLDNQDIRKFITLFNEIPFEIIALTQNIIDIAQVKLKVEFNVNLIIALADHINFSVNQYKQGFDTIALVNEEIKRFYKEEYEIGLLALNMINTKLEINLRKEESTSIAFHLITATENRSNNNILKVVKSVSDILKLAEDTIGLIFDEDSLYTSRFILHLKFFIKRILFEKKFQQNASFKGVYKSIQKNHLTANLCVDKIYEYVNTNFDYKIDDDEKLYLLIHVIRLIEQKY